MLSPGSPILPDFQKDPTLVRGLRADAEYFGLDGLIDLLKSTKTTLPKEGNQGILHWLGTKKGKASYQNPHIIGAIHVGGWIDDEALVAQEVDGDLGFCREEFVHYHGHVKVHEYGGVFTLVDHNDGILFCDHAHKRLPVVIDLKTVHLRPTHYSLRASQCYGMLGDWNFEGSCDAVNWDTLHASRNDTNLNLRCRGGTRLQNKLTEAIPKGATDEEKSDIALRILEGDFRHTWELTPPPANFYRYFRIIGAGDGGTGDGHYRGCLHGEGLELYGNIYEE